MYHTYGTKGHSYSPPKKELSKAEKIGWHHVSNHDTQTNDWHLISAYLHPVPGIVLSALYQLTESSITLTLWCGYFIHNLQTGNQGMKPRHTVGGAAELNQGVPALVPTIHRQFSVCVLITDHSLTLSFLSSLRIIYTDSHEKAKVSLPSLGKIFNHGWVDTSI